MANVICEVIATLVALFVIGVTVTKIKLVSMIVTTLSELEEFKAALEDGSGMLEVTPVESGTLALREVVWFWALALLVAGGIP